VELDDRLLSFVGVTAVELCHIVIIVAFRLEALAGLRILPRLACGVHSVVDWSQITSLMAAQGGVHPLL
jgi:hypothetical protein